MKILHAQNNKVKATVRINRETFRCDFILDDNLKIISLGIENDHMLAPDDIEPKAFREYQETIDAFIKEQSNLRYKSNSSGCYYRVNKTKLESASSLDDGSCDEDWFAVYVLADSSELPALNEFFKSNFTAEELTVAK